MGGDLTAGITYGDERLRAHTVTLLRNTQRADPCLSGPALCVYHRAAVLVYRCRVFRIRRKAPAGTGPREWLVRGAIDDGSRLFAPPTDNAWRS